MIRDADLELLLAESDRDEPFLVAPRRPERPGAARGDRRADPRRSRHAVLIARVLATRQAAAALQPRGGGRLGHLLLAPEERAPDAQRRAAGRRPRPAGGARPPRSRRRGRGRRRRAGSRRAPSPAAAAASDRISGSSRSKPPQKASRPAASTNAAPRPLSAACAATRMAAGTSAGKVSGHIERQPQRRRRAPRRRPARRPARLVVGASEPRRSAVVDAGVQRHVVERALDALGGEVRERARQVEEELGAQRRRPLSRPVRRACLRSASLMTSPMSSVLDLPESSVRSVCAPLSVSTAAAAKTCASWAQLTCPGADLSPNVHTMKPVDRRWRYAPQNLHQLEAPDTHRPSPQAPSIRPVVA